MWARGNHQDTVYEAPEMAVLGRTFKSKTFWFMLDRDRSDGQ